MTSLHELSPSKRLLLFLSPTPSILTLCTRIEPVCTRFDWHSCRAPLIKCIILTACTPYCCAICLNIFSDAAVVRLSWRQSLIVWQSHYRGAGRKLLPSLLNSTSHALFVKLLYFRAVLLLGHLWHHLHEETTLTFLFYSLLFYGGFIISSLSQWFVFMISNIITSLLDMTAPSFCCLLSPLSVCTSDSNVAIIFMFPFKQTTGLFKQISFSINRTWPVLWSLPQGHAGESPMWPCVSVVIIYYADIRERRLRLDYPACVLRCFRATQ